MKLTTILIIASLFHASASSYSQNTRLSLKFENETLEKVFRKIEESSEFSIFYKNELIQNSSVVEGNFENTPVSEILDKVLASENLDYLFKDNLIIIVPKNFETIDPAQQRKITGTVTDATTGEPVIGAYVMIEGTNTGVTTDVSGKFSLEVPSPNSVLVVSYIGYNTERVMLEGRTSVDIKLVQDITQLDEVVVIGYGTQRKSDVTSAIAKVTGEKLEIRPVMKVDQALQGQLAGVMVQQSGGRPGKSAVIRVRGVKSITAGNDPLYVVDGFPVDREAFANVSLNDIESLEVLKDAASASIYGSRGANGVVLVTTKRGTKELQVNFNTYQSFSGIEKKLDLLSGPEFVKRYADVKEDYYQQDGGDPNVRPIDRASSYRYDNDLLQTALTNPSAIPTYDPLDAVLRTGRTQNYQLSLSGSSQAIRYLVSSEYNKEEGIIKNTDYTRYAFRANIDADVNKYLTVGLSLNPTYTVDHDKDTEGKDVTIHNIINAAPTLPPRQGYWGESEEFSTYTLQHAAQNIAKVEQLKDENITGRVLANIYAQVNILPSLSFKSSFGANYFNNRRDRFQNQIITRTAAPNGAYWQNQALNYLNENILNFNKTFDKHNLAIMAGFTAQKDNAKSAYISASGFPNDYVTTLGAAQTWTATTSVSEWTLLSYLGRLNYSYEGKYLLTVSARRDGSSRFGDNTKWGWFPSASLAWRVDQESFMKNAELVSQLKLRASWGKTGNNNIGNYGAIPLMYGTSVVLGTGETKVAGYYPGTIANPNLGWETTKTLDFGVDLGILKDRITLTVDYYNSRTSDLLLNVPVPTITGFTTELQNIGEVENRGWEFELRSVNLAGRKLRWTTNFNLSFNKNEVLKLGPNDAPIISGDWYANVCITTVGHPIGSFYVFKQTGVYNTQEEINNSPHWTGSRPGDVIIEDYSGPDDVPDGVIDANDRQIFGSNIPKYNFGITNNLNYMGFDFSFFITGVGGNQIFNAIGREMNDPSNGQKNHYAHWANRWRSPEEPGDGITPRATQKITGASGQWSSRYIYNGSYVRFKNISLGYTLPKVLTDKVKLSKLRIYGTIDNVHMWDHYVGFTPEVDLMDGDALRGGLDYGSYPTVRSYVLGLNVAF